MSLIKKQPDPTEMGKNAQKQLEMGGGRGGGGKKGLDWSMKTQTKKQTDAWEEKKKKGTVKKNKQVAGGRTGIVQRKKKREGFLRKLGIS